MNAVIVTGATSMLGIATIRECIKNNVRVIALARADSRRKSRLPQSELLTRIECDLGELSRISLPEEHYAVFFHFGWGFTDRATRDDPLLQNKNIEYTLDAVQVAHKYGCRKFLGAGSQAEYGFHNGIIAEDMPVMPDTCYGYTKYAAGRLAEKLCGRLGMACIWARIFSVYGCNDGENTMISYALRQHGDDRVARLSSGTQTWDYLYEEDAGRYFFLLGEKAGKSIVVNVASGDARPLREYIAEMAGVLDEKNPGRPFRYTLGANASGGGIYPDVSRLREMTGHMPQIRFSEGIRRIRGGCRKCGGEDSHPD